MLSLRPKCKGNRLVFVRQNQQQQVQQGQQLPQIPHEKNHSYHSKSRSLNIRTTRRKTIKTKQNQQQNRKKKLVDSKKITNYCNNRNNYEVKRSQTRIRKQHSLKYYSITQQQQTMLVFLMKLLLFALLLHHSVSKTAAEYRDIEYFETPEVSWSIPISSGKIYDTGFYKGNGIVYSSHYNEKLKQENLIISTSDNGWLHVMNARDGSVVYRFFPPVISDGNLGVEISTMRSGISIENHHLRGWFTQCSSQPVLHYTYKNDNGSSSSKQPIKQLEYIVYAVVDTPPLTSPSHTDPIGAEEWFDDYTNHYNSPGEQSRILAVNANNGSLRWSVTLEGVVSGTPVIGEGGKFVYVVHNINSKRGHISILTDTINDDDDISSNQRIVYTRSSESGIFAPLSQPVMEYGLESLFWGETLTVNLDAPEQNQRGAEKLGYAKQNGRLRVIRDLGGGSFSSGVVKSGIAMTTMSAPTVRIRPVSSSVGTGIDDLDLWMSGTKAAVVGWVNDQSTQKTFSYRKRVHASLRNSTMPIESRVVHHPNLDLIYTAATSPSFYCLHSLTGEVAWKDEEQPIHQPYNASTYSKRPLEEGTSVIRNEPRVSIDGQRVFAIRHNDGKISAYNAQNGIIYWSFSCRDLALMGDGERNDRNNMLCQSSVEAEFTISDNGLFLYYGDIYGRITSLQVARHVEDTASPSSKAPSAEPTPEPSISILPSAEAASGQPSSESTILSIVPSSIPPTTVLLATSVPSIIPTTAEEQEQEPQIESMAPSLKSTATYFPSIESTYIRNDPTIRPIVITTSASPSLPSFSNLSPLPTPTEIPANNPPQSNYTQAPTTAALSTSNAPSFNDEAIYNIKKENVDGDGKEIGAVKQILTSGGLFLVGAIAGIATLLGSRLLYKRWKKTQSRVSSSLPHVVGQMAEI